MLLHEMRNQSLARSNNSARREGSLGITRGENSATASDSSFSNITRKSPPNILTDDIYISVTSPSLQKSRETVRSVCADAADNAQSKNENAVKSRVSLSGDRYNRRDDDRSSFSGSSSCDYSMDDDSHCDVVDDDDDSGPVESEEGHVHIGYSDTDDNTSGTYIHHSTIHCRHINCRFKKKF